MPAIRRAFAMVFYSLISTVAMLCLIMAIMMPIIMMGPVYRAMVWGWRGRRSVETGTRRHWWTGRARRPGLRYCCSNEHKQPQDHYKILLHNLI